VQDRKTPTHFLKHLPIAMGLDVAHFSPIDSVEQLAEQLSHCSSRGIRCIWHCSGSFSLHSFSLFRVLWKLSGESDDHPFEISNGTLVWFSVRCW